MAKREWHVYMDGECVGPLSSDAVAQMLTKNRLQFSDFGWTTGFSKWVRLSDVDDFQSYLPTYPKAPIPAAAEAAEEEEAPAPPPKAKVIPMKMAKAEPAAKPVAKPAPKAAAAAAVAVEEEAVEEVAEEVVQEAPPPPKPVAKAAPKPVAKAPEPAPKPVAKPAPKKSAQRVWRVPIDAKVTVDKFGTFKVLDISEGGVLLEAKIDGMEDGTDLKLHIESPSFPKPLDMTGIVVRQEELEGGKKALGIEFTKANPAHKRAIASYVASKLQLSE